MSTKFNRCCFQQSEEVAIINSTVAWAVANKPASLTVRQFLTNLWKENSYVDNIFCAKFRALHSHLKSTVDAVAKKGDLFRPYTLNSLISRTLGLQDSYKNEARYAHRAAAFESAVRRAAEVIKPTSVQPVPSQPVVAKPQPTHSMQEQVVNFLVNSRPDLVAAFVNENRADFIEFCLGK